MMLLLLLLLVATGALSENPNMAGANRCGCTECLELDGERYVLSNSTANMTDKCEQNGCLMMKETDQTGETETCICHDEVTVPNTWETDYDECIRKLIPTRVELSTVYENNKVKFGGDNCINGNKTAGPICHSKSELEPYLALIFAEAVKVTKVIVWDDDCTVVAGECPRLQNVEIFVGGGKLGKIIGPGGASEKHEVKAITPLEHTRIELRIVGRLPDEKSYLHLQEVEVWGLA